MDSINVVNIDFSNVNEAIFVVRKNSTNHSVNVST